MKRRSLPGLVLIATGLVSAASCSPSMSEIEPGVSIELARERAAVISDLSYRLRLDVPEAPDEPVAGRVVIAFELADASKPLQIDFRADEEAVHDVRIGGRTAEYRVENEHIVLPAAALSSGRQEIGIDFVAGSAALNRSPEYLYTLFVPDRARTAFPLFDQPDLKATFELTLAVPAGWEALSNAAVESVETDGGMNVHRFGRSDRISSYLFSFVAGRFETITLERAGRRMTLLHRETDEQKVRRNTEAIFDLHAASLEWLERYTGVSYPFQKLDFALIPDFQYGGMEHVGAILYRASRLLLDESPSDRERLQRASVIAHETAHAWFGNLVTMEWFDDVWMKEVFANFMAAKAVNPAFPDVDHDLGFLVDHYPAAYSIDRTAGANPIRQRLANLNEAGQLYGPIIYDKAPIMMRQLEELMGEGPFRDGIREYLRRFAFANAGWPALIEILAERTDADLWQWSEIWVNTPGRPEIELWPAAPSAAAGTPAGSAGAAADDGAGSAGAVSRDEAGGGDEASGDEAGRLLLQVDPSGAGRVWPQRFEVAVRAAGQIRRQEVVSAAQATAIALEGADAGYVLFNSDALGYGLFPADIRQIDEWDVLTDLEKGSVLVNLFENLLAGRAPGVAPYFAALQAVVRRETNQLLLDLAIGQLETIYWRFLPVPDRDAGAAALEEMLWQSMLEQADSSRKRIFFDAFAAVAVTPAGVARVHDVWSGQLAVEGLALSESELVDHAQTLAIKMPGRSAEIIAAQLARTANPDSRRKLEFVAPSLSPDAGVRDDFFDSLTDAANREVESWVLDALDNLHHPLRVSESEKYLLPSLELLAEIQVTGDIFFPSGWLNATLRNYRSASAVRTVNEFLAERPDYNAQLRMKILQAADPLFRANRISGSEL